MAEEIIIADEEGKPEDFNSGLGTIIITPPEVDDGVVGGSGGVATEGENVLAGQDDVSVGNIPLSVEAQEEPGFVTSVVEGFGVTDDTSFQDWLSQIRQESVTVGAGEVLAEQQIKRQDPELFNLNRGSEVYGKWQPQIWEAQEKLFTLEKTSPEYQRVTTEIADLRRNLTDDLAGNYVPIPEESPSFSKILDTVTDNPSFFIGALAKGIVADPGLMMTPAGWTKAGFIASKMAKSLDAGRKTVAAAELAGKVVGGGSITGGFGGAMEVVNQLKSDPNAPINAESVMKTAATFSILGAAPPPIIAGTKGAATSISKGVGSFYTTAKINQITDEAVKIFNEAEGGLSKQQAVEAAVAKHHPFDSEKVLTRLDPDEVVDDTAVRIAYGENRVPESFSAKVARMSLESTDEVIRGWNNLVQPTITGIRRLGFLTVATNLLRHDMKEMKRLSDRLIIKDAYSKARKQLSNTDKDLLKFHALNGTMDQVQGRFPKEVVDAYKNVRVMLEEMRADMIDNGMLKKKKAVNEDGIEVDEDKLPGIEEFWPRDVDFKALAKSKGVDVRNLDLYAKYINKKYDLNGTDAFQGKDLNTDLVNEYLSPEEIAFAIADEVSGKIVPKTTIATDPLKKRTVDLIEPEDLQFYSDDVLSLTNYILKMTPKIEARNFFGGELLNRTPKQRERFLAAEDVPSANPLKKDSMIRGFVDDYTKDLVKQGDILADKAPELAGLLEARFAGGFKRPSKVIAGTKNILYGFLLGNAWSAAVQLGDLGSSAYINGTMRTINAVNKRALKKAGVDIEDFLDMDDFGLSAMAHELEHLGPTATFNDLALKVGMFKMADRLGKEAIMNASVAKNKSAVKALKELRELDPAEAIFEPNHKAKVKAAEDKAMEHFRKQYGDKVDDETIRGMMEAFVRGNIQDPDAMLATFADITKVQPVSLSEMPKLYLNHPDGRIVYMLKTFTLKQVDLLRTSILQTMTREVQAAKTKKGKIAAVARGTGRTAHLLGTIGLANAGVDSVRKFLSGDPDFDLDETMFSAAFFRTWGYQPYLADLVAQGQIGQAAGALFFPPLGVITEPIEELAEGDVAGFLLTLPVLRAGKQFADQENDKVVNTFGGGGFNTEFSTSFEE